MKLGEILDKGFSIYRKNFWLYAGVALVPSLIVFALHVIDLTWVHLNRIDQFSDNGGVAAEGLLVWLIFFHLNAFIVLLFYPAFVKAASDSLFGEKASILGSLRFAAVCWRRYLWIDFLKQIGQMLIPEGLCVGAIFLGKYLLHRFNLIENNVLIAFILIAPTVVAISVMIRVGLSLAFAIPAAALEEIGGFKAFRRSWDLSKGGRGRVAVSWALVAALTGALRVTLYIIVWRVESLLYSAAHMRFITLAFYRMSVYSLGTIFNAVFAPLYPIVLLLLYYDQRVRKEGYDIEQMIEAAGLTVPVAELAGEVAAAPAAVETADQVAEVPEPQSAGERIA
jgi:hypothetical protein